LPWSAIHYCHAERLKQKKLKVEIVFNPSPLPLSQRERGIKPFSLGESAARGAKPIGMRGG
jgi:hypothetical protein